MTSWTEDDALAYECARECINHVVAICSAELWDEEHKLAPDSARIGLIKEEMTRLAGERRALRLGQHAEIARVRAEYGAQIRAGWKPVNSPGLL
ncbi:hypothetical protein [Aromatoleum aromaticum]|uniref:Uncharacterized protein n=1 Tax=Aromatoleum aromaticum (strain DSM 19018 / LMG 30748 / EbN1) TaxID=76114 RepID=Q5P935_AROAE|nr:hypothetical protein [Aromatoleum aromaticum]NMG56654.1 hypothetical protein [Aromatoleum aromaticum]CAI06174.1 hypothetical protein ebA95 [Aromatoleum aromaticum EbN1]